MSRRRDMQHDDRGAAEVVASIMIAPVVVGFTVLVFFLGRQVESRASVRTAADSAAQAHRGSCNYRGPRGHRSARHARGSVPSGQEDSARRLLR